MGRRVVSRAVCLPLAGGWESRHPRPPAPTSEPVALTRRGGTAAPHALANAGAKHASGRGRHPLRIDRAAALIEKGPSIPGQGLTPSPAAVWRESDGLRGMLPGAILNKCLPLPKALGLLAYPTECGCFPRANSLCMIRAMAHSPSAIGLRPPT